MRANRPDGSDERRRLPPAGSRAQAYTLEGVIAALVLLSAVALGMQTVDANPWTSVSESQTSRLEQKAEDVLTLAAENGALSRAVRCYSPSKRSFDGGVLGRQNHPDWNNATTLARMLNQTFDAHGDSYKLYFVHWNATSGERERVLASARSPDQLGQPSPDAAVVSRQIALYDRQPVRLRNATSGEECALRGPHLENVSSYYIADANRSAQLYNVVEVQLVVW